MVILMKKILTMILLALIFTMVLFSCGNQNGERYSYEWLINETVLPSDSNMYPFYDVHIPKFDLKSPYSDVINAEIMRKIWEYPVTSKEVVENSNFECVKTFIFENGDILSVLMIHQRFPTYGTDGDIFAFNYDLKNKMPVTISYELEKSGKNFDGRTAQEAVISVHGAGYYTIENLSYDYFYYNDKGELIAAITYAQSPGDADSWRHICFYNIDTSEIIPFSYFPVGGYETSIEYKIG